MRRYWVNISHFRFILFTVSLLQAKVILTNVCFKPRRSYAKQTHRHAKQFFSFRTLQTLRQLKKNYTASPSGNGVLHVLQSAAVCAGVQ